MKKILLALLIFLIFSCVGKSKYIEVEKKLNELNEENQKLTDSLIKGKNPYNGIWLDINNKGQLESNHFIVIEVIDETALVIDFQIDKKEIIKNSFYASYIKDIIEWQASPLSFTFEYHVAKDLKEKPAFFNDRDSVLKVTQTVIMPEADKETYEGFYIKLNNRNINEFLKVLSN